MTLIAWQPLAAVSVLVLTACGGGGDATTGGAPAGAKFTSPDSGIAVIAAAQQAFTSLDDGSSGAKSATASKALRGDTVAAKSASAPAKANSSGSCNGGGNYTFTDNTATTYDGDGTRVDNSCTVSSTSNNVTTTVTADGKELETCTDSAQTATVCNAYHNETGESARPYTASIRQNSSPAIDLSLKAVLAADDSNSGSTSTTALSGTISAVNNSSKQSVEVSFDKFATAYTTTGSGSSETINGGIGVSSSKSQCAVGKVSFKTNQPIVSDNNGKTVSGNLTMTDSAGQSATLVFNSDDSITVTFNGASKTYTAAQIDAFCN